MLPRLIADAVTAEPKWVCQNKVEISVLMYGNPRESWIPACMRDSDSKSCWIIRY